MRCWRLVRAQTMSCWWVSENKKGRLACVCVCAFVCVCVCVCVRKMNLEDELLVV